MCEHGKCTHDVCSPAWYDCPANVRIPPLVERIAERVINGGFELFAFLTFAARGK